MSTTDEVLVIILIVLLSIFFIMCIVLVSASVKLVNTLRRVADKAEVAVENVEAAAETLKGASGKLAFVKLVNNIIKMSSRGKK